MEFLLPYTNFLVAGLITTIEVTIFGSITGLGLGTLLAIVDLYGGRTASTAIRFYVEFFRGSPVVVQLFVFYYTIPTLLSIPLESFVAGMLVFSLNSAAYQKGYMKGAMESISEDQMTAALSIGLSRVQAIVHVILPQAFRLVIPAWGNEFSSLTKSTSALLVIAVLDLTSAGKTIAGLTFRVLETYAFIALIYLAWISAVLKLCDILYDRFKIPGIEISA